MTPSVSHRLQVEQIDGVTVAAFADEAILAEDVIREVEEQLALLVDGLGADKVLLSFREVRFLSSTMLAVLIKFARRVGKARGQLKLCCLAPHLREVFRVSRFDRLFEIFDNETEALDSFSGAGKRPKVKR